MILRITKILALFFIFLAITGGTAYLTLTWIIKAEDTVVVPDLVGKDVVYALEILTDLGLNTKVKGFQYSEYFPKNQVIIQEPSPGAEIKKGRDIRIFLSKGSKTLIMPNLIGLSDRQARLVIEENGLCLGHVSSAYYDPSISRDEIIAQTPLKDRIVNRGQCVNLLMSLGPRPQTYKMAAFDGLSIDEAVVLIERSNLRVGRIRYNFHPGKPENLIIGQKPEPGHKVTAKGAVDLIVNRKQDLAGSTEPMQPSGFLIHKLSAGFLKKHVKIRWNSLDISSDVVNELMEPGQELWLMVPTHQTSTTFVYEDETLVKTQVFGP
jgi:serine/threonine-protein kinase